jgi:hypothetical protein
MPAAIVARIVRLPGYGVYAWEADEAANTLTLSIRQDRMLVLIPPEEEGVGGYRTRPRGPISARHGRSCPSFPSAAVQSTHDMRDRYDAVTG